MHSSGKSWLLLTGCVVFYVIYLLFGALVFSTIERPVEEKLLRDLEALKQEFLNQSCASAASLERLLLQAVEASKSGVSVLRNGSAASSWDLTSSMFFANSLVTTIGEFPTEQPKRLRAADATVAFLAWNSKLFQHNDARVIQSSIARCIHMRKESQTFNKLYFNRESHFPGAVFSYHVSPVRVRM